MPLPVPLNLAALDSIEPKPPEFIVDDWLPAGEVALLAGHGGSGKSSLALHLAACIALGRRWHSTNTQQRRVAYFSFEDDTAKLHWRIAAICGHLDVRLSALNGLLTIFDGTRSEAVLFRDERDGSNSTAFYEWMRGEVQRIDAQVIVVDGISDSFAGNENSRASVKAFIRKIRNLLPADGSGAAILIGHTDKVTAKKPNSSQGYSGSTGWHNSVRARWYLRPDLADDGRLILELAKSNYGPAGAMMGLRWSKERGIHLREDIRATADTSLPDDGCRTQLLQMFQAAADAGDPIPAATSGQRTAIHVLAAWRTPALPDALASKANKKKLASLIEELRRDGSLQVGAVRGPDRKLRNVLLPGAGILDACGNSQNSRNQGEVPPLREFSPRGYGGDMRTPATHESVAPLAPPAKRKGPRKPRKQAVRRVVGEPGSRARRSAAVPST